MSSSLTQIFRNWSARRRGATLGSGAILGHGVDVSLRWDSSRPSGQIVIGNNARIETGVVLHAFSGRILMGGNVFLGPHAVIYGHGGVQIGDNSLISMHCRILSSTHTLPPLDQLIRYTPDTLQPTAIGSDVWLGAGVTVFGGVTIGDGCVVGAGSVVTKNLPPGTIAHGAPARVVRTR